MGFVIQSGYVTSSFSSSDHTQCTERGREMERVNSSSESVFVCMCVYAREYECVFLCVCVCK